MVKKKFELRFLRAELEHTLGTYRRESVKVLGHLGQAIRLPSASVSSSGNK